MPNRKAAAAAEAPDSPLAATPVAESRVEANELGRLVRAPENVRHVGEDQDVAELREDIAGHGLLQSLIGYMDPGEHAATVFIVGGGRRPRALELLREAGQIGDDYFVPVQIRQREEAIELSLAENLARRNMDPVDEFRAFKALMDPNPGTVGITDLARRFGYTTDLVRQRMRLADLAEEILAAVAEGRVTLDSAYAYASTQDLDVQRRVFKSQEKSGWKPHDPDSVRREIRGKTFAEDHRLVRFIGLEAYEQAGGRYEDGLFAAADPHFSSQSGRQLIDTALVRTLAREKMEREIPALVESSGYHALLPALEVDDWGHHKVPKAPKGTAKIETSWALSEADLAKILAKARKKKLEVIGVAAIDSEGAIQISGRVIFVPKDEAEKLKPKERSGYKPETPEQRAARVRAYETETGAARRASARVVNFGINGRLRWPKDSYGVHHHEARDQELGKGYIVRVPLFVTAEEFELQLEDAQREYDDALAAKTQAEAAPATEPLPQAAE